MVVEKTFYATFCSISKRFQDESLFYETKLLQLFFSWEALQQDLAMTKGKQTRCAAVHVFLGYSFFLLATANI